MDRTAITLICHWKGPDLFDSAEEEAMCLTVRAVFRFSCEVVSLLRNHFRPKRHRDGPGPEIREPVQDDAWVSFEFPLNKQTIRCVVVWGPEDDDQAYALTFSPRRGWLGIRDQVLDAGLEETIEAALKVSNLVQPGRWLSPSDLRF